MHNLMYILFLITYSAEWASRLIFTPIALKTYAILAALLQTGCRSLITKLLGQIQFNDAWHQI